MLGELPHVESAWAAVAWAMGGAAVLARRAIVSLFIRGSSEAGLTMGGLFRRRISLRQAAFAVSGVFIVGALLFFAAPPFRQGLRVSLAAWLGLVHTAQTQPSFQTLAQRAWARKDAKGLAFAAASVPDTGASARLAQEAVGLDPNLLWIYALVALKHPGLPEIHRWSLALERFDPQNALIPLITAVSIGRATSQGVSKSPQGDKRSEPAANPAWQTAMASAFACPKFDDYSGRLRALGRASAARYLIRHPQALAAGQADVLPVQVSIAVRRYENHLLESGERREARGDLKSAGDRYWSVARFGQVLDSQAHGAGERRLGASLQSAAYERLGALSSERGRPNEAALLAYLVKNFGLTGKSASLLPKSVFGDYVAKRNAFVLQVSALMVLIFSGLLIADVSIFAAGRSRSRFGLAGQGALMFVFLASATGLLISSATVYLTYRPYS